MLLSLSLCISSKYNISYNFFKKSGQMKTYLLIFSFFLFFSIKNKAFCSENFYSLKGGISTFTSKKADEYKQGLNIELAHDMLFSKFYEWNITIGYEYYSLKPNDEINGDATGISLNSGLKYYFNRKKYELSPYAGFSIGVMMFMENKEYIHKEPIYEDGPLVLIETKPFVGISYPISRNYIIFSELCFSPNIEVKGNEKRKNFFSDVSTFKLSFGISVCKDK